MFALISTAVAWAVSVYGVSKFDNIVKLRREANAVRDAFYASPPLVLPTRSPVTFAFIPATATTSVTSVVSVTASSPIANPIHLGSFHLGPVALLIIYLLLLALAGLFFANHALSESLHESRKAFKVSEQAGKTLAVDHGEATAIYDIVWRAYNRGSTSLMAQVARKQQLQGSLDAARKELEIATPELEDHRRFKSKMIQDWVLKGRMADEAIAKSTKAELELKESQSVNNKLQSRNNDLAANIRSLNDVNASSQLANDQLKLENNGLTTEIKRLNEGKAALEEKSKELADELLAIKAQFNESREKLSQDLASTKAALIKKDEQLQQMAITQAELATRLIAHMGQIAEKDAQLAAIAKENEDLKAVREILRNLGATHAATINSHHQEVESIRASKDSKIATKDSELASKILELAAKDSELAAVIKEREVLLATRKSVETLEAEHATTTDSLRKEVNSVRAAITAGQKREADLEAQLKVLEVRATASAPAASPQQPEAAATPSKAQEGSQGQLGKAPSNGETPEEKGRRGTRGNGRKINYEKNNEQAAQDSQQKTPEEEDENSSQVPATPASDSEGEETGEEKNDGTVEKKKKKRRQRRDVAKANKMAREEAARHAAALGEAPPVTPSPPPSKSPAPK